MTIYFQTPPQPISRLGLVLTLMFISTKWIKTQHKSSLCFKSLQNAIVISLSFVTERNHKTRFPISATVSGEDTESQHNGVENADQLQTAVWEQYYHMLTPQPSAQEILHIHLDVALRYL